MIARLLHRTLMRRVADHRPPDFIIGGEDDPYLRRWWVIPRNRFFNVYLHHFMRSDDDRALHDHPWWNVSLLLDGSYVEHTPRGAFVRVPGAFYLRRPEALHRVQLLHEWGDRERPVWTLFITGPKIREWGFTCPKGWRHWRDFCAVREDGRNAGTVGQGCGE